MFLGILEVLRVPIGGQEQLCRWCCLAQDPLASEQVLVLLDVVEDQAIAFQPRSGASVLVSARTRASSSPTIKLLCELTVNSPGGMICY